MLILFSSIYSVWAAIFAHTFVKVFARASISANIIAINCENVCARFDLCLDLWKSKQKYLHMLGFAQIFAQMLVKKNACFNLRFNLRKYFRKPLRTVGFALWFAQIHAHALICALICANLNGNSAGNRARILPPLGRSTLGELAFLFLPCYYSYLSL